MTEDDKILMNPGKSSRILRKLRKSFRTFVTAKYIVTKCSRTVKNVIVSIEFFCIIIKKVSKSAIKNLYQKSVDMGLKLEENMYGWMGFFISGPHTPVTFLVKYYPVGSADHVDDYFLLIAFSVIVMRRPFIIRISF